MREYGDFLVSHLREMGVKYIFGVPGGAIEPLYNALARSERLGGPRAIIARHETGAAFMAEGYARETGKLGVCCATSGPGTTNLITGVASAFTDGIPMLVVTGQPALPRFGASALQESSCTGVNTLAMLESCTVFNTLVSHPDQFEQKLAMAFRHALGPTPGPAHLSVPLDVMRAPASQYVPACLHRLLPEYASSITPALLEKLQHEMTAPRRLTLLIGEGAAKAMQAIIRLAEHFQWLLVVTPRGKGLVPESHALYRGVYGFAGHQSAATAVSAAGTDLVLIVGTELNEVTTGGWTKSGLLGNRLVHLSENPSHLQRSPYAAMSLQCSIEPLFSALCESWLGHSWRRLSEGGSRSILPNLPGVVLDEPKKCGDFSSPIKPQALFRYLGDQWTAETRVYADSGCSYLWGIHYACFHGPLRNGRSPFQIGIGFSSMGWAIGAAVGAAFGSEGQPVVCITGDGSFLMSGQEITTALHDNLNVLFIILNDASLGMVKHGQRLAGAEAIGTRLPAVDFALMAHAMGVKSHRITSFQQLNAIDFQQILTEQGPCLLDIAVDPIEVPPMLQRMRVLNADEMLPLHP